MRLSEAGRRLIQRFEGLSLTAYPDGKAPDGSQLYSIGFGHNGVARGAVIDAAEADRLFDLDVARFERSVSETTPRATQAQFDAMVSLAYNVGTKGFESSTVARLHNAGDYAGAADAFRMWNKSGGRVLQVLVDRREVERAYYLGGSTGAPSSSSRPPASSPALPSSTSSAATVDANGRISFGGAPPRRTVSHGPALTLLAAGILFVPKLLRPLLKGLRR